MDPSCLGFKRESQDFLDELRPAELTVFIICGVLCLADIIIFVDNVVFLYRKHSINQIKDAVVTSTWVVGLCPTLSVICWFSMMVPNAFLFRDVLVKVCLSVVMYKFVELAALYVRYYDGVIDDIRANSRVVFSVPPFACCCKCLPTARVKRSRTLTLKLLVLQFPVLCVPISVLRVYLWVDGKYNLGDLSADNAWPYLTVLTVISSLTAMYGMSVLLHMVQGPLHMTYITHKFVGLKLCVIIYNVQHAVFSLLVSKKVKVFNDRACFPGPVWGGFYEQMAFMFELFLISLLNLWAYKRPILKQELDEQATDLGPNVAVDHPAGSQYEAIKGGDFVETTNEKSNHVEASAKE